MIILLVFSSITSCRPRPAQPMKTETTLRDIRAGPGRASFINEGKYWK